MSWVRRLVCRWVRGHRVVRVIDEVEMDNWLRPFVFGGTVTRAHFECSRCGASWGGGK